MFIFSLSFTRYLNGFLSVTERFFRKCFQFFDWIQIFVIVIVILLMVLNDLLHRCLH